MTLEELKTGESAVIDVVGGEGELRQHFLDMGVIPGTDILLIKYAPLGDPMEFMIHGYELTLRVADAEKSQLKMSGTMRRKRLRRIPRRTESESSTRAWARAASTM